jgi:hypothetical protein
MPFPGYQTARTVANQVKVSTTPTYPDVRQSQILRGNNPGMAPSNRRLQTLQYTVSALQKLAATRNCVIAVLSQCATKMQSEKGATLIPAVNAGVWEQGISTRLVVFRDWVWNDGKPADVRFVGIQKLDGKTAQHAVDHLVAFKILTVSFAAEGPYLDGVGARRHVNSILLTVSRRA